MPDHRLERILPGVRQTRRQNARPALHGARKFPRLRRPAGALRLPADLARTLGPGAPLGVEGMAPAIIPAAAIADGALIATPVFAYATISAAPPIHAVVHVPLGNVNSHCIHTVHLAIPF